MIGDGRHRRHRRADDAAQDLLPRINHLHRPAGRPVECRLPSGPRLHPTHESADRAGPTVRSKSTAVRVGLGVSRATDALSARAGRAGARSRWLMMAEAERPKSSQAATGPAWPAAQAGLLLLMPLLRLPLLLPLLGRRPLDSEAKASTVRCQSQA